MAVFQAGLDDLVKFVMAQAAVLLIASALTAPTQKSVGPSDACLAGYGYYLRTTLFRLYFVGCMTCAFSLAVGVANSVRLAGGLQNMSATAQKMARAVAVVATLLSGAATVIAIATYIFFIQSTTVVAACFPSADRYFIDVMYGLLAVGCVVYPTYTFLMLALYAP